MPGKGRDMRAEGVSICCVWSNHRKARCAEWMCWTSRTHRYVSIGGLVVVDDDPAWPELSIRVAMATGTLEERRDRDR